MNCSDNGGKLAILHSLSILLSLFLSLFPDIITTKWNSHEYLILGAKYNLLNEKLNTEHNCHICEQDKRNCLVNEVLRVIKHGRRCDSKV